MWHTPFASVGWSLLICARGYMPHFNQHASSALLHSRYGLGRSESGYARTPAELGWSAPAPASCPPGRAPTASSIAPRPARP
jgi:hypothetical protein